jgi:glycosyltransferase involved in cell wall biosynthesis
VEGSVRELRARLLKWGPSFEILVAENGSTDDTVRIVRELADELPEVRLLQTSRPDYGMALREGILQARGTFVHCDEIDICDVDFHRRAAELLSDVDLVIGSKTMPGARDGRPLVRRVATRVINGLLQMLLGYRGTDTHGLKAFRREALVPVVRACVLDGDLFASELVIRAERAGLRLAEIPLSVIEKREPSVALVSRVPRVLRDLARLWRAVRR